MAEFEAYALGKADSYNYFMDQMEAIRKKHEELMARLSLAEDKAREYNCVKIHDNFVVVKFTPELMDEHVERAEVHPDNEIKIIWK